MASIVIIIDAKRNLCIAVTKEFHFEIPIQNLYGVKKMYVQWFIW